MLEIEVRPSNHLVLQISEIERFCGVWGRIAQNNHLTRPQASFQTLLQDIDSLFALDDSLPISERHQLREIIDSGFEFESRDALLVKLRTSVTLQNLVQALDYKATEINSSNYLYLHSLISCGAQTPSQLRSQSSKFLDHNAQIIFPNTPSFLLETRLEEILTWCSKTIETKEIHPLLALGITQLLLLQLSPFEKHSHCTALIFVNKQLQLRGYEFVSFSSPLTHFSKHLGQYYSALRQAEKTAGNTWSTLTIWLEHFLFALQKASKTLAERSSRLDKSSRLTPVQQDILQVVRQHGSASRDLIVTSTGINTSTVKYNLSLLAAHGVLRRSGGGRSTSYTAI